MRSTPSSSTSRLRLFVNTLHVLESIVHFFMGSSGTQHKGDESDESERGHRLEGEHARVVMSLLCVAQLGASEEITLGELRERLVRLFLRKIVGVQERRVFELLSPREGGVQGGVEPAGGFVDAQPRLVAVARVDALRGTRKRRVFSSADGGLYVHGADVDVPDARGNGEAYGAEHEHDGHAAALSVQRDLVGIAAEFGTQQLHSREERHEESDEVHPLQQQRRVGDIRDFEKGSVGGLDERVRDGDGGEQRQNDCDGASSDILLRHGKNEFGCHHCARRSCYTAARFSVSSTSSSVTSSVAPEVLVSPVPQLSESLLGSEMVNLRCSSWTSSSISSSSSSS